MSGKPLRYAEHTSDRPTARTDRLNGIVGPTIKWSLFVFFTPKVYSTVLQ